MDNNHEYLISLHIDLPPYNKMNRSDALKSIKKHCGIPVEYVSKYDTVAQNNVPTKPVDPIINNLVAYMNISTISEEEDVMSGSEEFYVEKWICRKPYNKMPVSDAEALIMSKLKIVHRK